jgi:hypothetical protein
MRFFLIGAGVGSICLFPSTTVAQYRAPSGLSAYTSHDVPGVAVQASTRNPSRVPYIIGGAAIGGVIAGVALKREADIKGGDPILGELVAVIVVASAMALGGLLGWAVHSLRY